MGDVPGNADLGAADVAGAPVAAPPAGFLVRLVTEPMWVLGLVLFIDEVDKNVVRG